MSDLSNQADVLVTGGAGFIGSHLIDALLKQGRRIRVVDDLSRGQIRNIQHCLDRIEFFKGDLTDIKIAEQAMNGCTVCYHLAAVVGDVRWMNTHPAEIFRNMVINYNVIETCRKKEIDKLVYTSSACVYPVDLQSKLELQPLKENDVVNFDVMPDGDYGWTKLMGEKQCRAYYNTYGLKIAVVRPFNPYGPRESFRIEDSHVIPALIRRAVNLEDPFIVWGNGEQRRTFTYVTDLADGMMLAEENISDSSPVNLGNSEDTSIRTLAELVLRLSGHKTKIAWDSSKPTGVNVRKSDMTKAVNVLRWSPKVTLEDGLRRTIDWYQNNKNSD